VRDESIPEQEKRNLGPKPIADVIAMLLDEVLTKRIRSVSTATLTLDGAEKFSG